MMILKRSELPPTVNDAIDDIMDGHISPYITVHKSENGTIEVVLDGRFDPLTLRRLADELVQMIGD